MYPWLEMNELDAKEDEDGVIISANFIFAVPGRRHVSQGRIEYRFDGNGMKIRQVGQINEELEFWLARYGYRLHFEDKIACVNYFGYGPEECYEDKREYATLDWYEYEPDDAKNSYEKPQECNSRVDTRWLEFSVGGESFVVSANKFSFCATSYDINENWRCLHKKDMTADGGSYLHLDYRMSGVGSKSCGGEEPYYQCRINPAEHFDFTFEIKRKGK
jgi:beta-galactosidase